MDARRRPRVGRSAWAVALLAAVAGCATQSSQFAIADQPYSCDEANRLAYRTIEAMRYKVSAFSPGTSERSGVIKASRIVTQQGGEEPRDVTITIRCKPGGADIIPSEDGKWLGQLEFERAYYHAYLNVISMQAARDALDRQIAEGTAPASQQRRDLKVVVEPRRGQAAKLDFAIDLAAAGILPVRVDITNLTPRTYTIDLSAVRLARADRERVAALTPEAAAARIAGASRGTPPQPVTTLPRPAIAAALASRQLVATEIPPGGHRDGFLYFPLADYVGARLVFTDTESGEDEGVRVEF